MDNLYYKIEPLLWKIRKPSRYIGHEFNSVEISSDAKQFNFCMIYPDVYDIGQSNQAVQILTNCVNEIDGFAAQRAYLPDPENQKIFDEHSIPMYSLETFSPLNQFDAIGITVSHDLVATNVLEVLSKSNIPILTCDRQNDDPFVFGGGPIYCNPEPYYKFFDVITIGEGEIATIECLKKLKELKTKNLDRQEILLELSKMDAIYVPSLYDFESSSSSIYPSPKNSEVPNIVKRAIYQDFSNTPAYVNSVVPYAEIVHNRLNVEILRGCARGCRFCQAGVMYRPVRERSKENICSSIQKGLKSTGYDEVSLVSLSTTDHSQISDIISSLNKDFERTGIRVSIPSQRLDSFGVDMAKLVAGQKKGGLTFAIEAGTQRLRDVINKNVTEDDIFSSVYEAFKTGWNRCKLYFMIGLPTETDDDLIGIANLCEEILKVAKTAAGTKRKHGVSLSISCAIFIPKANTPFMWDGAIGPDEARRKISLIRKNLKSRAINFSWHEPKTSLIEAVLSRGGRECSELIYLAWKYGAKFDAWDEYFNQQAWDKAANELGIDMVKKAEQSFEFGSYMPWSHIDLGISSKYFLEERIKADKAITTQDCTFESCNNCGVCDFKNCKNIIIGTR